VIRAVERYKQLLEQQAYFEAHEALEELWFPRRFEEDDEIKLLKGFINAAVSFELNKRGRKLQSKKVWANYLKYRQNIFKAKNKKLFYDLSRFVEQHHKEKNHFLLT